MAVCPDHQHRAAGLVFRGLWRFQAAFGLAFVLNFEGTVITSSVPEQAIVPRRLPKSFLRMMLMPFRNKVFVDFSPQNPGSTYMEQLNCFAVVSARCKRFM